MGKTIYEKILSAHMEEEKEIEQGTVVVYGVDALMAQDASASYLIDQFNRLNVGVFDPAKVSLVLDHSSPSPSVSVSDVHNKMRMFAKKHALNLYDVGQGICHQIMIENQNVTPGAIILGGETHTCMYGALNALGLAAGSTDLAAAMATGKIWGIVPGTVKINLKGRLDKGISIRDLALHLISVFSLEYGHLSNYVIEYSVPSIKNMSMENRLTLCNMSAEMGAISALMPFDETTERWLKHHGINLGSPIVADKDAEYIEKIELDLEEVKKMISSPHDITNVDFLSKIKNINVDQAIIGSCSNGQVEDYEVAATILMGKKVVSRMIVIMSSAKVYKELIKKGVIDIFIDAGATVLPPGCGPCVGAHMGIVGPGEVIISTTNRNQKGIMGSIDSEVYLASSDVVAASALAGKIVKPESAL